jgi:threonine/homoserine/homoserine lactone efflux protein
VLRAAPAGRFAPRLGVSSEQPGKGLNILEWIGAAAIAFGAYQVWKAEPA